MTATRRRVSLIVNMLIRFLQRAAMTLLSDDFNALTPVRSHTPHKPHRSDRRDRLGQQHEENGEFAAHESVLGQNEATDTQGVSASSSSKSESSPKFTRKRLALESSASTRKGNPPTSLSDASDHSGHSHSDREKHADDCDVLELRWGDSRSATCCAMRSFGTPNLEPPIRCHSCRSRRIQHRDHTSFDTHSSDCCNLDYSSMIATTHDLRSQPQPSQRPMQTRPPT